MQPVEPGLPRQGWRARAACAGMPDELFFDARAVDEGLEVCADCEVRRDCEAAAVRAGVRDGVWGGRTEDELRAAARRRHRPRLHRRLRHGTPACSRGRGCGHDPAGGHGTRCCHPACKAAHARAERDRYARSTRKG